MKIIIDIRDYRGEPMDAKGWPELKADGTVEKNLHESLVFSLKEEHIPRPNTITVTWEESK